MTVRPLQKRMHNLMFPTVFYKSLEITMWVSFPWHAVINAQMSTSRHTGFNANPSVFPHFVGNCLWLHGSGYTCKCPRGEKCSQIHSFWVLWEFSSKFSSLSLSLITGFFYLFSPLYFYFSFLGSKLLLPLSSNTCNLSISPTVLWNLLWG